MGRRTVLVVLATNIKERFSNLKTAENCCDEGSENNKRSYNHNEKSTQGNKNDK